MGLSLIMGVAFVGPKLAQVNAARKSAPGVRSPALMSARKPIRRSKPHPVDPPGPQLAPPCKHSRWSSGMSKSKPCSPRPFPPCSPGRRRRRVGRPRGCRWCRRPRACPACDCRPRRLAFSSSLLCTCKRGPVAGRSSGWTAWNCALPQSARSWCGCAAGSRALGSRRGQRQSIFLQICAHESDARARPRHRPARGCRGAYIVSRPPTPALQRSVGLLGSRHQVGTKAIHCGIGSPTTPGDMLGLRPKVLGAIERDSLPLPRLEPKSARLSQGKSFP